MTVAELKGLLEAMPANLPVFLVNQQWSCWMEAKVVEIEKIKENHEELGPGAKTKMVVAITY